MDNLLAIRKVGALGRVVIPDNIRDRLSMETGTPISIYVDGECVIIRKFQPEDASTEETSAEAAIVLGGLYDDIISGKIDKSRFISTQLS
jgi:AbrB family looped-hinge helix DNA binding protein